MHKYWILRVFAHTANIASLLVSLLHTSIICVQSSRGEAVGSKKDRQPTRRKSPLDAAAHKPSALAETSDQCDVVGVIRNEGRQGSR